MVDPRAGQRVRKDSPEVSPREAEGKVRPPGFLAKGGPLASLRIGGGQHTLSHTHMHPSPPVSNFEPHSHTAFGVFWTPQGRGTGDGAMVSKGEDQLAD